MAELTIPAVGGGATSRALPAETEGPQGFAELSLPTLGLTLSMRPKEGVLVEPQSLRGLSTCKVLALWWPRGISKSKVLGEKTLTTGHGGLTLSRNHHFGCEMKVCASPLKARRTLFVGWGERVVTPRIHPQLFWLQVCPTPRFMSEEGCFCCEECVTLR